MSSRAAITAALKAVVAIRDGRDTVIGSGVVVAPDAVLTSLHVIEGLSMSSVTVNGQPAPNPAVTLPTWRYGKGRRLAKISHRRSGLLSGAESDTVDLAILTVPGLDVPAAPVRHEQIRTGERVAVAGYPNGLWTVSLGPVTSADEADYVAHILLGPGSSGAPALDSDGRVCGVLTMDHLTAGAILIGPHLISQFTQRARRAMSHVADDCPWCSPLDGEHQSSGRSS